MSRLFSSRFETWLESKDKTVESLNTTFAQKSFAMALLLLLLPSALPLPTGGLTSVLEIIAMLLSIELMFGRSTIWLPNRWKNVTLNFDSNSKGVVLFLRILKRIERYSSPRMGEFLAEKLTLQLLGLTLLIFTIGSFLSPPFSGLDTLPSSGVVFIGLGLMMDDILLVIGGLFLGTVGTVLSVGILTYVISQF